MLLQDVIASPARRCCFADELDPRSHSLSNSSRGRFPHGVLATAGSALRASSILIRSMVDCERCAAKNKIEASLSRFSKTAL